MPKYKVLLVIQKRKLAKALQYLRYSYERVKTLSTDVSELNEGALETWESFAARFSRVAEIFLTQYLRTKVLISDPGFVGSLRDFVNQAEKLNYIEDASDWMAIRELRNITAHDYSEKELSLFFERLRQECPKLLNIQIDND